MKIFFFLFTFSLLVHLMLDAAYFQPFPSHSLGARLVLESFCVDAIRCQYFSVHESDSNQMVIDVCAGAVLCCCRRWRLRWRVLFVFDWIFTIATVDTTAYVYVSLMRYEIKTNTRTRAKSRIKHQRRRDDGKINFNILLCFFFLNLWLLPFRAFFAVVVAAVPWFSCSVVCVSVLCAVCCVVLWKSATLRRKRVVSGLRRFPISPMWFNLYNGYPLSVSCGSDSSE